MCITTRNLMSKFSDSCYLLWKTNNVTLYLNSVYQYLPDDFSLSLLNDGSLTKILDSTIGEVTQVQLVTDQKFQGGISGQNHSCSFVGLRMYRQRWLTDKLGLKLLFATSWYKPEIIKNCRLTTVMPLGKIFIDSELVLYRKLHCISCFYSKWFEKQFNVEGYIWSREYILYHKKSPCIFIREFLSPKLIKDYNKNI